MASNNKKPAQPHLKIKDLKTKKNPKGGVDLALQKAISTAPYSKLTLKI
jgi:hypothetical protein